MVDTASSVPVRPWTIVGLCTCKAACSVLDGELCAVLGESGRVVVLVAPESDIIDFIIYNHFPAL